MIRNQRCPIPRNPQLAEAASAFQEAGAFAFVLDADWRWAYITDELRLSTDGRGALSDVPLGAHFGSAESMDTILAWRYGGWTVDGLRRIVAAIGPWVLADMPGGRDELREAMDPRQRDIVDNLSVSDRSTAFAFTTPFEMQGLSKIDAVSWMGQRVRDEAGKPVGSVFQAKPTVGMSTIAAMVGQGDLRHFDRMTRVMQAGRRPAAILFADLEHSARLSRGLSTASYFNLGRRLVRAADEAVIEAGGLVGRHVGDGVVEFFLTETAGSESTAARGCIEAARALRAALADVASRSDVPPGDVVLRFGLHWGATLYVGAITTAGRSEVTALGDDVNECARIEACATGGRALASKALIERLNPSDADALGIDADRVSYTPLAELPTATEKARRDAPAVAVAEV